MSGTMTAEATARVSATINAREINLVEGGMFSLTYVVKLVCENWVPDSPRARTVKDVFCAFLNDAMSPKARAALCDTISAKAFDAELEQILTKAIGTVMVKIYETMGPAVGKGECLVQCSVDGGVSASVDVGGVVKNAAALVLRSYSGDGVDWGGLVKGLVDIAVTNAICCVMGIAASLAVKATKLVDKLNIPQRVAQFRAQCKKALNADGSGGAASDDWLTGGSTDVSSTTQPLTSGGWTSTAPTAERAPRGETAEQRAARIARMEESQVLASQAGDTSGSKARWILPAVLITTGAGAVAVILAARR